MGLPIKATEIKIAESKPKAFEEKSDVVVVRPIIGIGGLNKPFSVSPSSGYKTDSRVAAFGQHASARPSLRLFDKSPAVVDANKTTLDRSLEILATAAFKVFSGEAFLPEKPAAQEPGLGGTIVGLFGGVLSMLAPLSGPDTEPAVRDTDLAPMDPTNDVSPLYASVEAGTLRFLERSAPNFGGLGHLMEKGLDVFAELRVPNSTRLFPYGKDTVVFGRGSLVGHDRIQSAAMSPQHVKVSQGGKGLMIEDVSGKTGSPLWVGEKVPGTERYQWRKVAPGEVYETQGQGMVQIAVGPITFNEKGEPKDFKGAAHFGINGQAGIPRIFHME